MLNQKSIVDIFSCRKAGSADMLAKLADSAALDALPLDYVSRSGLTRADIAGKIAAMTACAGTIEQRHRPDGSESVQTAHHCQNPLSCQICAKALQSKRRSRLLPKVGECAKKFPHIYKVTFTIPDGADLMESGRRLKRSLMAFRRMGQRRGPGKFSKGEWSKVKAGVMSIENKRGENSGLWHVHAHAVLFCDSPIDFSMYDQEKKKKLAEKYGRNIPRELLESIRNSDMSKAAFEWYIASGGATDIDIQRLKKIPADISNPKSKFYSAEKVQMFAQMSYVESLIYQVKECIKYDTDFNSIENPADVITIITDCRAGRFYATFGEFRRVDFGRIVTYLRAWCNKKDIDQSQFSQWILRNTDLRSCIGNQKRLEALSEKMLESGFSDIEISAAFRAFNLRYKNFERDPAAELAGVRRTFFRWDTTEKKYVQIHSAKFDFGCRSELQRQINKITAQYRRTRGKAFRQYKRSPFLYRMLDISRVLMHSQISELINYWKQKSLYTHREGKELSMFTQSMSAYYYASAF